MLLLYCGTKYNYNYLLIMSQYEKYPLLPRGPTNFEWGDQVGKRLGLGDVAF